MRKKKTLMFKTATGMELIMFVHLHINNHLLISICINACLLKHCPFNNDIHFPYTLDMGQTIKTCLTTGNGTVE